MIPAPVISAGLNTVVLALTPVQRMYAVRQLNIDHFIISDRWYIIAGVLVIILLAVLLYAAACNRANQERKSARNLFAEYAEQRGLSDNERGILMKIAVGAGLRRVESIFTMASAFDRGVAKMVGESIALLGVEKSKQLKTALSVLREKLGFYNVRPSSAGFTTRSIKLSSRQIPVDKKLDITRRKTQDSSSIEATVIENNDAELVIRLASPIASAAGDYWCVHYQFGASIWEFDTSVVRCDGDIIILNHSDDVRFVNRRRFLRVPVEGSAFVARFPFRKTFSDKSGGTTHAGGAHGADGNSVSVSDISWGLPEFVPAAVTELAGPGLRVEANLEVKQGDKVLVVFRLDEEIKRDSSQSGHDAKTAELKVVEDIGEVRHVQPVENGSSIAIELMGLSDSDLNELIRATNTASLKAGAEMKSTEGSANAGKRIAEPV